MIEIITIEKRRSRIKELKDFLAHHDCSEGCGCEAAREEIVMQETRIKDIEVHERT